MQTRFENSVKLLHEIKMRNRRYPNGDSLQCKCLNELISELQSPSLYGAVVSAEVITSDTSISHEHSQVDDNY